MAERPSNDQRNTATFAALTMVLLVVIGLVGLVAFVIPDVLLFVLVPVGLGILMVLHYLFWGRWLAATLREQEHADETFTAPKSESDHSE